MPDSKLSFQQIIQRVFDEENEQLRTSSVLDANSAEIEIALSHTEDSIRIGNGTNLAQVDASGNVSMKDTTTHAYLAAMSAIFSGQSGTKTYALSAGDYLEFTVTGASQLMFRVGGTWSGLVAVQGSPDGTNFQAVPIYDFTSFTTQTYSGDNSIYSAHIGGYYKIRITLVVYTSGNPVVTAFIGDGAGPLIVQSPAAGGFYTTANLRDGSSTPLTSGYGNSTGALRTVSADQTVVDFLDTNPVLNTASTTIATASFNEVVASTAAATKKVWVHNTTAKEIGVYTGAAASEVLAFVITPAMEDTIQVTIPASSRISFKSLAGSDITSGKVSIQFIG